MPRPGQTRMLIACGWCDPTDDGVQRVELRRDRNSETGQTVWHGDCQNCGRHYADYDGPLPPEQTELAPPPEQPTG